MCCLCARRSFHGSCSVWVRRVDKLIVYASAQRRFAIEELGVAPDRVVLTPFMVDTQFFVARLGRTNRRGG